VVVVVVAGIASAADNAAERSRGFENASSVVSVPTMARTARLRLTPLRSAGALGVRP